MGAAKTKKQQHAKLGREARKRYAEFVAIQGGEFCAICGRPPKKGGRRLHIDHDHRTMEIRGLCCSLCNRRLRVFLTVDLLLAMAAYLKDPPLKGVN